MSLATATNWLFNTALAWAVPPGLSTIAWKTYFIFGTFNFAAFVHILFMYPETVGRSLEEVEEIFKQGHVFTAWKIGKDVGKKTLSEVVEKSKVLEVCVSVFCPLEVIEMTSFFVSTRRSVRSLSTTNPLHDILFRFIYAVLRVRVSCPIPYEV